MGGETTRVLWITRRYTTVRHVRGLLEGLEHVDALPYAEVRIMPVDEDHAVTLPGGMRLTLPDGTVLTVARVREKYRWIGRVI